MITVHLLGGACLRSGGSPLTGPPVQRHRIALLTIIVAAWPRLLSRDRAMALLWPERDLTAARRLLNLAVHVLRATLGDGAIVSASDGLVLDANHVSCDLHALNVAIAAGEQERVVRLYTGPLLDGFHLGDATEFNYWLDERRSALAHSYVCALLALAERQQQTGDVFGRIGTCRKLVAVDPYSTVHAVALMHALDAAGDRVAARHHAVEHAHRVRADLDVEPDPEIEALATRLRAPAGVRSSPDADTGRARALKIPSPVHEPSMNWTEASMPYDSISDLPTSQVDQYDQHQKKAFLEAFNSAEKEYHNEHQAFAVAHSAAKKAGDKDHDESSS